MKDVQIAQLVVGSTYTSPIWMIGKYQVRLSGSCSMEELRMMIDTVL